MNKLPITVTILTKNSERYLDRVLQPLEIFDEVLLFDTGSSDQTLPIAKTWALDRETLSIVEHPFLGFGKTHNLASARAKNDWILSIDSDEVISQGLIEEIQKIQLERGSVYSISRHNEYKGQWIKTCGWYPDRVFRLYHRQDTQFSDAEVHESLNTYGLKAVHLQSPLYHYSYREVSDFLSKMQSYSSLFALQYRGKKNASLTRATLHAFFAFFKSFVLKGGFWQGGLGYEISFYNGVTTFYKYLKLAEANQRLAEECGDDPRKKPSE